MATQDNGAPPHQDEESIKVYKKRWLLLVAILLLVFTQLFLKFAPGILSNVTVKYFYISHVTADWMIMSYSLGAILTTPFFGWLIYTQHFNFRHFVLICTACLMANSVFHFFGFLFSIYPLTLIGGITGGIALQITSYFPSKLAALWFPESQIGIATASIFVAGSFSNIMAFLLLPNILSAPFDNACGGMNEENQHTGNRSQEPSSILASIITDRTWFNKDRLIFACTFATSFSVSLIIFIFLLIFLPAYPEHPPSVAAASKRRRNKDTAGEKLTFKTFFEESRRLVCDCQFLTPAISYSILFYTSMIDVVMLQSIIKETIPLGVNQSVDVLSGNVLTFLAIGTFCGGLAGGKIIDTYKKYIVQSASGAVMAFVAIVGFALSCYYGKLVAVIVSFTVYGFSIRIGMISLFDAIMQHTYPLDPLFVSTWLFLIQECYSLVVVELSRLVILLFGSYGVLIYQCTLHVAAIILSLCTKPKLNRLNEENMNFEIETTRLIN